MKTESVKLRQKNGNWKSQSRMRRLFVPLFISLISIFAFASCADADGLHDQMALMVTFSFSGLGDSASGEYYVRGEFEDWKGSTTYSVSLSKGEGSTTTKAPVTKTAMKFTLCKNDTKWSRPWYVASEVEGNQADENTSGTPYWNFYIENLDLNAGEVTISVSSENLDENGRLKPVVKSK